MGASYDATLGARGPLLVAPRGAAMRCWFPAPMPTDKRDASAAGLFWEALNSVKAFPMFLLSIALGIATGVYVSVQIPAWPVVVGACVGFVVVIALVEALRQAVTLARKPRRLEIVDICKAAEPYGHAHALFIVRAPDGLPTEALLSFYCHDGAFLHAPLGFGTVRHQQDDDTYHVTLDRLYEQHDIRVLLDRNTTPLNRFSARPEVSMLKLNQSKPLTKDAKPELPTEQHPTGEKIVKNEVAEPEKAPRNDGGKS